MYYDELHRYAREMVQTITPFVSQGAKLTYDLQKEFAIAKRIMNNDMFLVECQVYDKKIDTSGGADGSVEINHYIKITFSRFMNS